MLYAELLSKFYRIAMPAVATLTLLPGTDKMDRAHASMVEPVVRTSSTTSTCLAFSIASSRTLKAPLTLSMRSSLVFFCLTIGMPNPNQDFGIYWHV